MLRRLGLVAIVLEDLIPQVIDVEIGLALQHSQLFCIRFILYSRLNVVRENLLILDVY